MKLRFWQPADSLAGDLHCFRIPDETLFVLDLTDGTICVLAVIRSDESLTATTTEILRGRERIARERLVG